VVIIVHEEAINQFPGMTDYGGVFSRRGESVRALDFILEYFYLVRATIDVVGQWSLKGFSRFSIIHLVWTLVSQWFGN
jgi:hypothetical protein